MRLASVAPSLLVAALAVPLAACASSPETSTGQLAKASDLNYQCDDSAHDPSFACGVKLAFDGDQLTATGVYRDGTAGGPGARGTLSGQAQIDLDDLIAKLPLSTPAMIHDAGCGGAPLRQTTFAVQFDDGQLREYTYEYGSGAAQNLDSYVLSLVRDVQGCSGSHIAFASCTPNAAPQL
ncbi:MAG: hypothetical protein JO257_12225 [Deltaproteobacteria bacterium]|nr:hypothetical protein [Deltaproteobacteria bacterium]